MNDWLSVVVVNNNNNNIIMVVVVDIVIIALKCPASADQLFFILFKSLLLKHVTFRTIFFMRTIVQVPKARGRKCLQFFIHTWSHPESTYQEVGSILICGISPIPCTFSQK